MDHPAVQRQGTTIITTDQPRIVSSSSSTTIKANLTRALSRALLYLKPVEKRVSEIEHRLQIGRESSTSPRLRPRQSIRSRRSASQSVRSIRKLGHSPYVFLTLPSLRGKRSLMLHRARAEAGVPNGAGVNRVRYHHPTATAVLQAPLYDENASWDTVESKTESKASVPHTLDIKQEFPDQVNVRQIARRVGVQYEHAKAVVDGVRVSQHAKFMLPDDSTPGEIEVTDYFSTEPESSVAQQRSNALATLTANEGVDHPEVLLPGSAKKATVTRHPNTSWFDDSDAVSDSVWKPEVKRYSQITITGKPSTSLMESAESMHTARTSWIESNDKLVTPIPVSPLADAASARVIKMLEDAATFHLPKEALGTGLDHVGQAVQVTIKRYSAQDVLITSVTSRFSEDASIYAKVVKELVHDAKPFASIDAQIQPAEPRSPQVVATLVRKFERIDLPPVKLDQPLVQDVQEEKAEFDGVGHMKSWLEAGSSIRRPLTARGAAQHRSLQVLPHNKAESTTAERSQPRPQSDIPHENSNRDSIISLAHKKLYDVVEGLAPSQHPENPPPTQFAIPKAIKPASTQAKSSSPKNVGVQQQQRRPLTAPAHKNRDGHDSPSSAPRPYLMNPNGYPIFSRSQESFHSIPEYTKRTLTPDELKTMQKELELQTQLQQVAQRRRNKLQKRKESKIDRDSFFKRVIRAIKS